MPTLMLITIIKGIVHVVFDVNLIMVPPIQPFRPNIHSVYRLTMGIPYVFGLVSTMASRLIDIK